MSVPLRVLGDRVLVQADTEHHRPTATASGLLTARSLEAAVQGSDEEDSWFVGTIVQVGRLVNGEDPRIVAINGLERYLAARPSKRRDAKLAQLLVRLKSGRQIGETLEPGDRVVFSWASGQRITIDGARFLILSAADILGKLEA